MSRALNDLDSRFRPLAFELIARCAEAGIPVMIIDTLRTPEEQADNLVRGVSWTLKSKHLPQPPDHLSLAIDLAPYSQYQLHGPDKLQWDEADPAWQVLGAIGLQLGLTWAVTNSHGRRKDLGHFEYVEPARPGVEI